jgi:hypothetical protein
MRAEHGYHDANANARGRKVGRVKRADPTDHYYYIQSDGDTRVFTDPRTDHTDNSRYRATCEVCEWVGPWRSGWPTGAKSADNDGYAHRTESLGVPGWTYCATCETRHSDDALCERHAAELEQHFEDTKEGWIS